MPRTGLGIIPGGAAGAEAQSFTRRTFVPTLFVQTRNATPTLSALLGNAKPAMGGISSITVPMQGGAFVNTQSSDYSGKFDAPEALNPGVNAEWNLKIIITPIPFLGPEGLFQWDAAIIPILAGRMNDAGNSAAEYLSTQLWNNAEDDQDINGFPLIASASGTYGGLSRSTYTWMQANVQSAGNAAPTRAIINQFITSAAKAGKGEVPDFGVTGPGTWSKLAGDFIGVEEFRMMPNTGAWGQGPSGEGPKSGFRALSVAGVPIYPDHAYGTEGIIYFFKRRYFSFYIHQAASWAFTGFQSTLANYQLGYVGALVTCLEVVNVKPQTVTKVTNLTYDTV